MKRNTKPIKLQLDRQTIRELAPETVEKVSGGAPFPTSTRPSCQGCLF